MDATPNLDLPYIMGAQAQKHVTHNEAIRKLDALVHLAVLDRDLAAPPSSPSDGDRYIVASSATDGWSGHDLDIAAFQDGAWEFYPPAVGWIAWLADENALVAWDGSEWVGASDTAGTNPVPLVGVNSTADSINRLAVKSDAVLFSHDDVTPGSGDQRTILNKSATNRTASFVFQSDWSGRAEMGLAGNDDFAFKVSPDGAAWHQALLLKKDGSAAVFGPQLQHTKPPRLPSYTTGTLPSASTYGTGSMIYVGDWPNGGVTLISDGVTWRPISPRRSATADILGCDEGIALNFRAREARINDYADVLSATSRPADVATLTRASNATYFDRDRKLVTAGSNALRFTHDPMTGEPRGLLLEGASTNYCLRSGDQSHSYFSGASYGIQTIAANGTAPDGSSSMYAIIENTANNHHTATPGSLAIARNAIWCFSAFVQDINVDYISMTFNGGGWIYQMFRLSTAEKLSAASHANSTLVSSGIEPVGGGIYRIWLSGISDTTSGANGVAPGIRTSRGGNVNAYTGDGTSGFRMWGCQIEAARRPSSYIPTTSATASRAADSLLIGPNTFPVRDSGECTLYWRGRFRGIRHDGNTGQPLGASNSDGAEAFRFRDGTDLSGVDLIAVDGGSEVANTAPQAITLGSDYAFAMTARPNDIEVYSNGTRLDADTSLTLPTIDRLCITPNVGSIYEVDEIAYIARARTASELALLSGS